MYHLHYFFLSIAVARLTITTATTTTDTAVVYRNEEYIGTALKTLLPKYNLKREDIFITSKLSK